ncbi:uncharacterized protein MONOS_14664c2 [Monocercomonoides exilis]|uniref:uncharacterized protein n=1 Tax=Monocercomonoides exilis TaxID=2049356 RepID=UPI00355997BE|nr:hypothetical protein MONOS_14664c1 [Monocercomonoides exilis]KAH7822347.1 hypothetical protein MONOS_14664c2 [Monocercomonoides exilis]|eukprot:MONOS_14664.1-p1 / transcript=MONOS_14664.1 / gene=MONOS_14664 / organism=Monocercomonoides_exilis_PA203 / gene_product=unspecified product / transcript_product=unspecified product / location=Mono_scaffold01044:18592-19606(+) / protein_length=274 / sequence_SO=supercontig / SO=protein_coding / is_pseudo=false
MSASQFPPIVGLTPSAEAAMQNSGAQSQPGTLSQPNIFSSASIFSPSPSEGLAQEATHSDDRKKDEDDLEISQRICQETKNWINDALDQAGYKMEIFLFQAIKAALIGLAETPTSSEGAKQRLADILILVTKALQEARTVRIQGRFGFRAATLMSTGASTGILTERQELILREARQEANLLQENNQEHFKEDIVIPFLTQIHGFFGDTPGPQRSQEGSNSEEGGTRAVGAGDQGCVNNFRSSSQGNRAEEAHWRENRFVSLSMEANRRREIDK